MRLILRDVDFGMERAHIHETIKYISVSCSGRRMAGALGGGRSRCQIMIAGVMTLSVLGSNND